MKLIKTLSLIGLVILLAGSLTAKEPFHETVDFVDLERFSGDWYVIALMPTFIEKNAVNGIENYTFDNEGKVHVEYTFFKNSPNGKRKLTTQRGWIINKESNADWRVQPLWPLRLPYYILDLADDYRYTVIGTNNYKYLWIMAREPTMEKTVYDEIVKRMEQRGYDTDKIQIMKQEYEGSE